tara:strand:- start:1012 stop:1251 length:240 start_codon:yes stop_codon:yes gene_type:complete
MTIFDHNIFDRCKDPKSISVGDFIEYELLTSIKSNEIGKGIVLDISDFGTKKSYFLVNGNWIVDKRVVIRKQFKKRNLT